MKKVLILVIVLLGLLGVAVIQKKSKTKRLAVTATREKLLDKFDVNTVQKIRLKDGDKSTTVAVTGDHWTVAERSGYPASFDKISKTLLDLADQKVGKKQQVGKGAWGDVKLLAPGQGVDAAKAGFLVELLGEGDKPLKTLVLGSNVETSKAGEAKSPFGGGGNERFVRLTDDGDTVWVVGSQFYDLQPKPEDWIDKAFIDVQKIKAIDVVSPKAEDSWKASRKAEADTEFALEGGKPDESLDNIKAGLTNLLSSPSFTDVLPKDKATADFMKDAWQAKITTFDGFTYNLKALKKGESSAEKYYLTVAVTADLPKERPPVKDEKPEDKKKADDEFAAKKKALEDHLAKDKKAEGWVYEMSSYSLGSLMKKKSELLKDKAAATTGETNKDGSTTVKLAPKVEPEAKSAPAPAPMPAPAPPVVKKEPVTVTTPPVSVPLPTPPKMEVKPTPPANANPATGQPSPPPATAPKPPAPATPAPAAPPAEPKK